MTVHAGAARTLLAHLSPEERATLDEWAPRFSGPDSVHREYAVYGQPYRNEWPLEQIACALLAHGRLLRGDYAWLDLPLCETAKPAPDRERKVILGAQSGRRPWNGCPRSGT